MQGRVGAPPLTHLRGAAAIASRRNAALRLNLGTAAARHPYLGLRSALPRGFVAAVYDFRNGEPSGAHRDAATAIARQRAIRENSVYSWMKNQHGFESQSIFEWRGFPVSKKIIQFPCDADAIGQRSGYLKFAGGHRGW
jgi:hypothetical protein